MEPQKLTCARGLRGLKGAQTVLGVLVYDVREQIIAYKNKLDDGE
jgi:hypothetical protein